MLYSLSITRNVGKHLRQGSGMERGGAVSQGRSGAERSGHGSGAELGRTPTGAEREKFNRSTSLVTRDCMEKEFEFLGMSGLEYPGKRHFLVLSVLSNPMVYWTSVSTTGIMMFQPSSQQQNGGQAQFRDSSGDCLEKEFEFLGMSGLEYPGKRHFLVLSVLSNPMVYWTSVSTTGIMMLQPSSQLVPVKFATTKRRASSISGFKWYNVYY
ncbi:unnamed protein product [Cyprideis torosa]|uniref:Uncharacterized protein n=1 Tax=Cyprideis torosa TaxID=163714 RepID=A0A7R8WLC8_9CRUS|nr:unnamed protein product [Cyprideis torosa]CAG0904167.1 unnamed protein product [Cyprideis torosa]